MLNQPRGLSLHRIHAPTLFGLGLMVMVIQLVILVLVAGPRLDSIYGALTSLDATWYSKLSASQYHYVEGDLSHPDSYYAFFPFLPVLLALLRTIIPSQLSTESIGAIGASFCFLIFMALLARAVARKEGQSPIVPKSYWGLFAFLCNPGVYVFFSCHTEAYFLLFSLLSLLGLQSEDRLQREWAAPLWAGLAALTRNQGIMLAIAVGIAQALREEDIPWSMRLKAFALSGLKSFAVFSPWPIFLYLRTGSPLASLKAQSYWKTAETLKEFLYNCVYIDKGSWYKKLLFWSSLVVAGKLARKRESFYLGFYILVSVIVLPIQGGGLPQASRFMAPLFPFWFYLGDKLYESMILKNQKRLWLGLVTALTLGIVLSYYSLRTGVYYWTNIPHKYWPY